jgi:hypothetical protein
VAIQPSASGAAMSRYRAAASRRRSSCRITLPVEAGVLVFCTNRRNVTARLAIAEVRCSGRAYCVLMATEVSPRSTPLASVKVTKTRLTLGESGTAALPATPHCVLTATEVSPRSTPPLSVKVTKTRLPPGESAMVPLPVAKMPNVGAALAAIAS